VQKRDLLIRTIRDDASLSTKQVATLNTGVYIKRKLIHWEPYNENISSQFWASGTSLIGVAENKLLTKFWNKGIRNIRIILPNPEPSFMSYWQLHQYDNIGAELVYSQIYAARRSYITLKKELNGLTRMTSGYIKHYGGIMFNNITIYDDDAFISFYDTKGIGDINITLHFNKTCYPEEYGTHTQ
jgi:hypothetical protein